MSEPVVLIVDDDKKKQTALSEAVLTENPKAVTHVAESVTAARRLMRATRYDLVLLDLVLPLNDPKNPSRTGGLTMLELMEGDEDILRPLYVVGVTGFEEVAAEQRAEFLRRTWCLIEFDPGATDWQAQIRTLVAHLGQSKRKETARQYGCDILFLTALRKPELVPVLEFPGTWEPTLLPLGDQHYCRRGKLHAGKEELSVVSASTARMGLVWTSILAAKAIDVFRPKLLVMTGICMGIPGATKLGDLVVATTSWNWQAGKLGRSDLGVMEFRVQPEPAAAPRWIINLWHEFPDQVLANLHSEFGGIKPDTPGAIHIGPMVSGSSVVADESIHGDILKQDRKIVGVDMEAFALYAACEAAEAPKPAFFCVKAVSDFGTIDKHDNVQLYGSYKSAAAAAGFAQTFWKEIAARF